MDNFILIPTGKPAMEGDILLNYDGKLELAPYKQLVVHSSSLAQHLYHLADYQANTGEWYYAFGVITKNVWHGSIGLKVLQSTNPDLNLPLIPKEVVDEFIKSYNQVPA
ncbi:hypothetical protein Q5H92_14570 [Hymenobacter sp. M29]|uniref:Uncharacterized protein n=1 Tax=Hymenobacter mellowenesis TaxID=3063995 RepID=A0ABT9ACN3_9BACT|nr:hypothetical protein [Hymenobacter sp. M29]MDO7847591.1 hypothetical protein [Hymenobacter sp. M29]